MQCVQVASVRWKIPCDDANWVYYSTSMAWDDYRLVSVQLHTGILPGPGPASYIPRSDCQWQLEMLQGGHGLGTWEEALERRPNPV